MRDALLRVRIPMDLFKRYKHLCIENELSLPKQTTAIIGNFVQIHEENARKIKEIKGKSQ